MVTDVIRTEVLYNTAGGLMWFRRGISAWLLRNFGSHKMRGIDLLTGSASSSEHERNSASAVEDRQVQPYMEIFQNSDTQVRFNVHTVVRVKITVS
jgi:hypothetical protein